MLKDDENKRLQRQVETLDKNKSASETFKLTKVQETKDHEQSRLPVAKNPPE